MRLAARNSRTSERRELGLSRIMIAVDKIHILNGLRRLSKGRSSALGQFTNGEYSHILWEKPIGSIGNVVVYEVRILNILFVCQFSGHGRIVEEMDLDLGRTFWGD